MLTSLKIENVAIIESAAIEFGCGLNVLTGETGAGKSIVIDSINAILGERTSREIIRTGAQSAKVYAVFEDVNEKVKAFLDENGIDCEDGVLIINRTLNRDGKNICRLNGAPVTVSMLRELGGELIDIHGQHDSQSLLSPEKHCGFVDGFAENADLISDYREKYRRLCEIRNSLKKLTTDESSKSQRIDFLTYQIDELEKSDITPGERDELKARKALINNSQKVMESLNTAYMALKADGAGIDMISNAESEISNASEYMESLGEASEKITDIRYELDDIAELVRDAMSEIEFDPSELDDIEERLDLLYRLSKKYGETEEEMLDYLARAREELDSIAFSEEKVRELQKQEKTALAEAEAAAERLTESRKTAGEKLSKAICSELEFLDMPNVRFVAKIEDIGLTENGRDSVEFLISANVGEEPKPLAKIASGGELSRIMLAIKNVLAETDGVDTMIFDEIDTGVSGRAAQKIAMKLRSASKGRQVICVTHLAQIAAQGDVHLYISKSVSDGKTYTNIKSLIEEERVSEIARIMGGMEITQLQLESAREMLANAGNLS
ncbi:MAG: DNA repair protein RecN [Clostridiaceae bacterium]|nr:DNA repair protein RecN [Clostridiaceae bacterium]MDY5890252.1 DNA repair protein RecN [Oscillospiraceae bacterium]